MLTGKNSVTAKQYNRGLLLKLIATHTCRTRTELSRMTGLTKMTVSNIVSEFIKEQLVVECEEEQTLVCGRNPVLLKISPEAPKVIGLLIFRDRIEAVLSTLSLEILGTERIFFQHLTQEALWKNCFHVIDSLLKKEHLILGIGVAAIGPVDIRRGVIMNPPRFYGIENVRILEVLKDRYGLPVFLDHDNNSAALAEKMFGAGKDADNFIFLGISNGIGSGIVSGGKVYHGSGGFAPEIGHVSIDRNGLPCACGSRGCLEMYACTHTVTEKLKNAAGMELDFARFCRLWSKPAVNPVFEELLQDITVALVNSVNILHPEMIILGHDCIDWEEEMVARLQELVNERRIVHDDRVIPVKKAYFGKNAQLIGAAANVADQVFCTAFFQ